LIEDDIAKNLEKSNEADILKKIQADIDANIASIVADSRTNDQQFKYIT
jgi:hypothetical protein